MDMTLEKRQYFDGILGNLSYSWIKMSNDNYLISVELSPTGIWFYTENCLRVSVEDSPMFSIKLLIYRSRRSVFNLALINEVMARFINL